MYPYVTPEPVGKGEVVVVALVVAMVPEVVDTSPGPQRACNNI
jgi:hypothetical protein